MRIHLSRPHIGTTEKKWVEKAFESNFVAPVGPQIDAFEEKLRSYLDSDVFCVAVSSGTAALHLALRVAQVEPGDHVWISSMTFAGGVFPANYVGAKITFFDVSLDTWTLDVTALESALSEASKNNNLPKVILATDLYGQSVDLYNLERLSKIYGIRLIVDSAESLGAEFKNGRKAGTGGDASIFSFNGNKIITTSGGGMLVTRHEAWAREARFLATQARDPAPHYQHSTYGYNYRLSNICAAIGLGQMEVLDDRVARRRAVFERYREAFARPGVEFMPEPAGQKSSRWLTTLTLDPDVLGVSREDIRLLLLENQIEARPLWKPMHLQPLYAGAPYHGNGFDERLFHMGLCLPSGSDMSEAQQDEVIQIIQGVLP